MHEHSSASWFFITQPIPSCTIYPKLIFASLSSTIHSFVAPLGTIVYFGHIMFREKKSFGTLSLMTGPHYLWMPGSSIPVITQATNIDFPAWLDKDLDTSRFSSLVFPWAQIQAILAEASYWDCSCSYCLASTGVTRVIPPKYYVPHIQ